MEEKKIRLLDSSENAIVGQLAVFNWKLKDKKPAKKMGPFKTNEYTFEREEAHPNKEAEMEWEGLFQQWNDEYMFKKYPRYLLLD